MKIPETHMQITLRGHYFISTTRLEKFSKLRDFPSLNKGEEILLTIQGDTVECKCANGGTNIVCSEVFTKAVCDVYFGSDPVSPAAKESVLAGMNDL